MAERVERTGVLRAERIGRGTRAERDGLVLEADDGRVLVVRRRGAPTYGPDPGSAALAALAGSRVRLTGTVVAGTMLADRWEAA